ncbi:probable G-protein coupled receptor No18 [Anastrepha ludens]|uniref:probable G-protein coupled receptor No18 n=1 Tax=Anastrepha ludens TaxID=28586 RepID=UPI0023AF473E|nr:probable G-protein coupled receptor No18 [Anastrepha ludens]XP_053961837.1 probable G-protein coupled receptor No18 [Anastrepha ludens]
MDISKEASFNLSPPSFIYYTAPTPNSMNVSQSVLDQRALGKPNFSAILATVTDASTQTEQMTNSAVNEFAHFYDLMLSWQGICLVTIFCGLIVITVLGNTLVIMAIITTRRLRTVTNCFVMSLAVADFLVGIFVMPPAVAVYLVGSWRLGWILCDIWISLDILLCTASILSLCAISIDRYLAVTKPLKYSHQRRSKRLALLMILIVWLLALAITCPPMLGWYEPGRRDRDECRYNQNKGYVIYSASGSFFLPMIVMIYVYVRISCVIASRHDKMIHTSVHSKRYRRYTTTDSNNYAEHHFFELACENSTSARRFSNQTIVNELNEVVMPDVENGRPLLSVAAANGGGKGNICNLTRPVSWKSPPATMYKFSSNAKRHQYARSCPPGSIAQLQARGSQPQQQQLKSLANCIISLRKEHKTTQTLSIVVGGFIACWLPFFIYYLSTPFLEQHQVSRTLTNVLTWLGWLNSAINPFIYAFYSIDFRVAFWRLICRRFCSNTLRPRTPTTTTSTRL